MAIDIAVSTDQRSVLVHGDVLRNFLSVDVDAIHHWHISHFVSSSRGRAGGHHLHHGHIFGGGALWTTTEQGPVIVRWDVLRDLLGVDVDAVMRTFHRDVDDAGDIRCDVDELMSMSIHRSTHHVAAAVDQDGDVRLENDHSWLRGGVRRELRVTGVFDGRDCGWAMFRFPLRWCWAVDRGERA